MRVTVSLTEKAIETTAAGSGNDLRKLVRDHSSAEVVRVLGRGRFASIETDAEQLNRLKAAIGDVCVYASAA